MIELITDVSGIGRRIYRKGKIFIRGIGPQGLNDDGTFTVYVGFGATVILPEESFKIL